MWTLLCYDVNLESLEWDIFIFILVGVLRLGFVLLPVQFHVYWDRFP